jgi:hypothetical protein
MKRTMKRAIRGMLASKRLSRPARHRLGGNSNGAESLEDLLPCDSGWTDLRADISRSPLRYALRRWFPGPGPDFGGEWWRVVEIIKRRRGRSRDARASGASLERDREAAALVGQLERLDARQHADWRARRRIRPGFCVELNVATHPADRYGEASGGGRAPVRKSRSAAELMSSAPIPAASPVRTHAPMRASSDSTRVATETSLRS